MEFLGIIPARGGSKGFPGKNIARLGGRPLICHTCEAALESEELDRVVVSTDSGEIAAVARSCGADVPELRPGRLAEDDTLILPVIQHVLEREERQTGETVGSVVLLQPTSPLRTSNHVDEAIRRFRDSGADTLVSVMRIPHQFNPDSLMREEGGWLVQHGTEQGSSTFRRQDKMTIWARNGPAILIVQRDVLLQRNRLYGERIVPYPMSVRDSIDIDEPIDLEWAEFVLQHGTSS